MTITTSTQLLKLGNLATARGSLGPAHSQATDTQLQTVARILSGRGSYSSALQDCVICVEDRLGPDGQRKRAARLAGGGLSLGLMYNMLFGGACLSVNLLELRRQGFLVVLHNDCGALKLALSIVRQRLANIDADGYKVLHALGVPAPSAARHRIAKWATSLPDSYVDIEESMRVASEAEQIIGQHNAVAIGVSLRDGESFIAGPQLARATNGLLAFGFDPWAAVRAGNALGASQPDRAAAALLGQVFTAEVLLQLAGPDMGLWVHR